MEKKQESMESYLQDESKMRGWADEISFPESVADIQACLKGCRQQESPVTIQGGLTGLCGGAVPHGGHILNLSKMNRFLGMQVGKDGKEILLTVEAGVLLEELQGALTRKRFDTRGWLEKDREAERRWRKSERAWFFPPDPTETLASLGGMAACNASGACSFRYGAMRAYVQGITVVLETEVVCLKRGEMTQQAFLAKWGMPTGLELERTEKGKNAAGYLLNSQADAVDLFLGSEGTLGVLAALELRILPKPTNRMGILGFFPDTEEALAFVRWLRGQDAESGSELPLHLPAAIEYFNPKAFQVLEGFLELKPELRRFDAAIRHAKTGIYVEYHMESEAQLLMQAEQFLEEAAKRGMEEGSEWCAWDQAGMEQLKQLRHAVPECVNLQMDLYKVKDERLRKLGTDFAVSDEKLLACMQMYEQDLERVGINSVIFGHVGDNHLHVNLLPETWADYEKGLALIEEWASRVIAWGGTITAEHGVGRLKRAAFGAMFHERDRNQMRKAKLVLDPSTRFNPGVIFSENK